MASTIGTLMLIGCTVNTGEDTPQQAGKSGIAGAKSLPGGLAGASAAGAGGGLGQGGAGTSSAGVSAGGASAGGVSAGGASAGGASAGGANAGAGGASAGRAGYGGSAAELPVPGFSWGGSNSFGFAGFANLAGSGSVFRIDLNAGAGGTGNITIPSAFAGTTFWISD